MIQFGGAKAATGAGGGEADIAGGLLARATPFLGPAVKIIGIVVGLFFLLLALPAAPIIIYLSILFNVIKLMWEKLKEL
jgi:hypothetical protein